MLLKCHHMLRVIKSSSSEDDGTQRARSSMLVLSLVALMASASVDAGTTGSSGGPASGHCTVASNSGGSTDDDCSITSGGRVPPRTDPTPLVTAETPLLSDKGRSSWSLLQAQSNSSVVPCTSTSSSTVMTLVNDWEWRRARLLSQHRADVNSHSHPSSTPPRRLREAC